MASSRPYRSHTVTRGVVAALSSQSTTDHDPGAVVYLSSQPDRSRPPARSCTYRANLLQITTPARSCTYRANLLQITTPARSCTYRAMNLTDTLQIVTRGVVAALSKPSRDARRRCDLNEANFNDLIDVSESNHNAPAKHFNPYSRRPWLGFTCTRQT